MFFLSCSCISGEGGQNNSHLVFGCIGAPVETAHWHNSNLCWILPLALRAVLFLVCFLSDGILFTAPRKAVVSYNSHPQFSGNLNEQEKKSKKMSKDDVF